ncbi:MAG: NUDIX domain-containing protein [Gammaproteobacteria bacterium]|nr:MAG: NUDIX domain-containing protein [Gammaproteobacteria bacterium]
MKDTTPRIKYGLILINPSTHQLFVLRRINYALYNRINNHYFKLPLGDMSKSMCPGFFTENMFEFPKGNRDRGETPLSCAIREFNEETGIKIDRMNYGFQLKPWSITVESSTLDAETIEQRCRGSNNINYVLKYFVMLFNFQLPNDTTIIKHKNLKVLGDNFNIVVCTKWDRVRHYFILSKFNAIVKKLDKLCGLFCHEVDISENEQRQNKYANK